MSSPLALAQEMLELQMIEGDLTDDQCERMCFIAPALARHVVEMAGEIERLKVALSFYADPEEYFAVGILGDRPCGAFADDYGEWAPEWNEDMTPPRHGAFARRILGDVTEDQVYEWRANRLELMGKEP